MIRLRIENMEPTVDLKAVTVEGKVVSPEESERAAVTVVAMRLHAYLIPGTVQDGKRRRFVWYVNSAVEDVHAHGNTPSEALASFRERLELASSL